jgi:hypothetical protein
VQNNTGINNDDFKVRTDIKRSLENSPCIAQNSESTFHIPSFSAQAIVLHSFINTQIHQNIAVYFCLAQIPYLLQRSGVHLVSHWVITRWAKNNKINFNENKSKVMLITRRKRKEHKRRAIYMENKRLEQVETLKYLGIIIDSKINFKEHITYT